MVVKSWASPCENVGWRIDYQACSPDWKARTANAWVYKEQWFSDHAL